MTDELLQYQLREEAYFRRRAEAFERLYARIAGQMLDVLEAEEAKRCNRDLPPEKVLQGRDR